MRRTVLAEADGVMGVHKNYRHFHDRGQTDWRLHVITENKKGGSIRPYLGQRHAVHECAHRVLANAKVKIAAVVVVSLEIACSLKCEASFRRRKQIRRPADKPWHILRQHVQYLAGRFAGSEALGIGRKGGKVFVTAVRELATLHALPLVGHVGILPLVLLEFGIPFVAKLMAPSTDALAKMFFYPVRNEKFSILGPAVRLLGKANFVLP